jgi:non-ribosomal peptide synthetase component F
LHLNVTHTYVYVITDSVYERELDMSAAKIYWRETFRDYNIEKQMALPIDRRLPINDNYSGHGFTVEINFPNHIVKQLTNYASQSNVTLYQVCLTIYYIFLFKLTGGQQDLIVGIVQANRYRPELGCLIGMFVNTLPMRVRIELPDTFEQVLRKVSDMIFETQPYSNLPYQCIIEQLPMKSLHGRGLIQTMFTLDEYRTARSRLEEASIVELCPLYRLEADVRQIGIPTDGAAMFDMTLSMEHMIDKNVLHAKLTASSDLFDSTTVVTMAQRFQTIVQQLFSATSELVTTSMPSVCDLSLILPEEIAENILHSSHNPTAVTNPIGR